MSIRGIIVVILLFPSVVSASKKKAESDFQKNFNIAKQHLSQRKINEALPYLMYLNKKHPNNENLKYLIGVCYAEMELVNPKTLELLSTSAKEISLDYDPNSLEESKVPIYVYYYLSVAYAQNRMCEQAIEARNKFIEIYPYKDKYYLEESQRWIEKCKKLTAKPELDSLPKFPNFEPYSSEEKEPTILSENPLPYKLEEEKKQTPNKQKTIPKKIITKKVDYSTLLPLYGVQLGAYTEVIPVSRFKNMKNIDAFMDKDGLIRYVIGHFSLYTQAESLLKLIQEKGYSDAFVVDVNSAKKFKDEVVSVNNVNIKSNPSANVEYRIQIGAFKEELTDKTAKVYTKIEGIKEHREEEITYLTVGKFKTYPEAKAYSLDIKAAGLSDAFVIALKNGKKISLQQIGLFNR